MKKKTIWKNRPDNGRDPSIRAQQCISNATNSINFPLIHSMTISALT